MHEAIAKDASLNSGEMTEQTILEHFRLLQACDNLSLLTCVAFDAPAHPVSYTHLDVYKRQVELPWPRTAATRESKQFEEQVTHASRLLRGAYQA